MNHPVIPGGRARVAARRGGLLVVLLGLLTAAAAPAGAAAVVVGPGETLTMTADVVLGPTDTFMAQGTAEAPCVIDGGGMFRLLATDFTGTVLISHCTLQNLSNPSHVGVDLRIKATASVRMEDSILSACGLFYVLTEGDSTVAILRNDFLDNGTSDPNKHDFVAAQPTVKFEGMGTPPKFFQGNRVFRSLLRMERTQNWLIGGLTEAAGNIFYGDRGGIYLDRVNDITISGNYLRIPAPWNGFGQLTTLRADNSTGIVIEHNLIRGGNGILFGSFDGAIRYNILADPHAAFWMDGFHGNDDLKIHHNLLLRSEASELEALYWRMNGLEVEEGSRADVSSESKLEFFNNTMDGAYCYNPPGSGVTVGASQVIKSVRNNVFTRMAYSRLGPDSGSAAVAAYKGEHDVDKREDPGPERMAYADYNDFFNAEAPVVDNYGISVAGKSERLDSGFGLHDLGNQDLRNQQADPVFVGPQPVVFPFSDDSLTARVVTVCQVLKYYRGLYTPAAGKSPLIDRGDPADGDGVDIGAIGAGVEDPADRFGRECPADIGALPPPSGDMLKCAVVVAPAGSSGGSGATPQGNPGWLCVCTVAAPPSGAGVASFLALLGVAGLRRRRGWTRRR